MKRGYLWTPPGILAVGLLLLVSVDNQRAMTLDGPLSDRFTPAFDGYTVRTVSIPEDQLQVAGVSDHAMLAYEPQDVESGNLPPFTVYVGYYERQTKGQTIHSPKNCLPGAGWETVGSMKIPLTVASGAVAINRHIVQREDQRALVLYWYQGRGRIESNEYVVKWDLLRDAVLRSRTEEALVRIVLPLDTVEDAEADRLAVRVAEQVAPALAEVLPAA